MNISTIQGGGVVSAVGDATLQLGPEEVRHCNPDGVVVLGSQVLVGLEEAEVALKSSLSLRTGARWSSLSAEILYGR